MSVEAILLFVLGTVAVIVAVRLIANKTGLPAAALLTMVGIGYALLPGPNVTLKPEIVLTFVIPPLLYSAALDSSLLAIRRNLRTVVSLSVVLVFVTALTIGAGFSLFVSGATLAAGVALGAAVAPPDPVAALAVGRKVGLPPRLITLIQGEGLLNDATALTILSVAVAAASGTGFSMSSAVGLFVVAAIGGLVIGYLVAYLVRILRPFTADPLVSNAISLGTPFAAYVLGEELHVSGVLAVVVAGLIVGHDTPRQVTGASRLQTAAVWRLVDFLLEGFVFLLIGQQLPTLVRGLAAYSSATIVIAVIVTLMGTVVLRPLWLVLTQLLPQSLRTRLGGGDEANPLDSEAGRLNGREVMVLSWAGTRGVITLAAIFTLPVQSHRTGVFPDRDLLLFCAFLVVMVTLIGQGLTFAPLVRALGLRADETDRIRLRNQARAAAARAALVRLDEIQQQGADSDDPVDTAALAAIQAQLRARLERYQGRLEVLEHGSAGEHPRSTEYESALRLRRAALEAEREELVRWRDAGQLPDEGLRIVERELDHEEGLLPGRG